MSNQLADTPGLQLLRISLNPFLSLHFISCIQVRPHRLSLGHYDSLLTSFFSYSVIVSESHLHTNVGKIHWKPPSACTISLLKLSESPSPTKCPILLLCEWSSPWLAHIHFSSIILTQFCLILYVFLTIDFFISSHPILYFISLELSSTLLFVLHYHIQSIRKPYQLYLWNLPGILTLYTIFTAIILFQKFIVSSWIIVMASRLCSCFHPLSLQSSLLHKARVIIFKCQLYHLLSDVFSFCILLKYYPDSW